LLLANNPQGGEHLKDLLVGQILWVSYDQLIPAGVLSAALLGIIWWRHNQLKGLTFYALFALAITASVQLVGVYLVFASLIVPALATVGLNGKRQLTTAYIIGIAGYVSGLALSAVFDLPSGALIVWTLGRMRADRAVHSRRARQQPGGGGSEVGSPAMAARRSPARAGLLALRTARRAGQDNVACLAAFAFAAAFARNGTSASSTTLRTAGIG
jgi:hypothetical protein